ncbi:MAG: hypothetical protein KGH57_02015 [Candidatus Micrarchaeota archaeon]|nr:hypothetical protein [Candidatus Micrarchaeota archaeon]
MQFFDLVNFHEVPESLAARLGYKKIFQTGKDAEVFEKTVVSGGKGVVRSDSQEAITKGLRQSNVIGVIPKGISAGREVLDEVKENEKMLIIPLSEVTCSDGTSRVQSMAKMRRLVKSVLMAKVPFALVSFASSSECLMAGLQMIEVAGFLGIEPPRAKEALGRLGELL